MSTKTLTRHTPPSRRAVQANALWWFLCVVFPIASVVLNTTNPHPYLKLGSLLLWMGCFAWALGLVVKDFMHDNREFTRLERLVMYTAVPCLLFALIALTTSYFDPAGPFFLAALLIWSVCFALAVLMGLRRIR